jgi:hypothetical protein
VTPKGRIVLALAVCGLACEGRHQAADAGAAVEHVELGRSTHTLTPEPYDAGPPSVATPAAAESRESSDAGPAGSDDDSLVGEERERDPRSDTVKIKVIVDAHRQAHVVWGRKDFGVAPLEIERPRNSGPLDLVVVAPGYLPLHARALTDRDDVLSLRIYSAAEAPQLLGYRPEAAVAVENGSATSPISPRNKGENARSRMGSPTSNGKTGDEKNSPTKPSIVPSAKKPLK